MLRSLLLIGLLFIYLFIYKKYYENYDETGYDNKRFLHCSDSRKINHHIKDTDLEVNGYAFNNNYFVEETDVSYMGGDGDFSNFLDVYKIRKEPNALQSPICMQKKSFDSNLNIPSFFRQLYDGKDSNELIDIERSFEDIIYNPFDKYRNPLEIKNRLILDDRTNNKILRQHSQEKDNKSHNNHIELKDFKKTCLNHDALGIPFQCGSREFNTENSLKECEDDSLSDISCNKICCKNHQESFIIS